MYSKGSHNTSAEILNARKNNSVSEALAENDLYQKERKRAKR